MDRCRAQTPWLTAGAVKKFPAAQPQVPQWHITLALSMVVSALVLPQVTAGLKIQNTRRPCIVPLWVNSSNGFSGDVSLFNQNRFSTARRNSLQETSHCLATALCDFLECQYRNMSIEHVTSYLI